MLLKNKKLFYKPTNFISISNLQFRMRKNGIGLATICLLSTMALVTLSAGISLFLGTQSTINRFYPMTIISASTIPISFLVGMLARH